VSEVNYHGPKNWKSFDGWKQARGAAALARSSAYFSVLGPACSLLKTQNVTWHFRNLGSDTGIDRTFGR
jgi:hypothetical protein